MSGLSLGLGRGASGGRIGFDEFAAAVKNNGYPEPSHATYWAFMNSARHFYIFDRQELAMILTHMLHESKGFVERRENIDLQNYPASYKDASCDAPGQLYYGRGLLKLVHCKNYRNASEDLFNDDRLVKNPDLMMKDEETAMTAAFSFWNRNVHDLPGVSEGHFGVTTKAINGASECTGPNTSVAKRRFEIYKEVVKAFKLKIQPDERGCYEVKEFLAAAKNVSKT